MTITAHRGSPTYACTCTTGKNFDAYYAGWIPLTLPGLATVPGDAATGPYLEFYFARDCDAVAWQLTLHGSSANGHDCERRQSSHRPGLLGHRRRPQYALPRLVPPAGHVRGAGPGDTARRVDIVRTVLSGVVQYTLVVSDSCQGQRRHRNPLAPPVLRAGEQLLRLHQRRLHGPAPLRSAGLSLLGVRDARLGCDGRCPAPKMPGTMHDDPMDACPRPPTFQLTGSSSAAGRLTRPGGVVPRAQPPPAPGSRSTGPGRTGQTTCPGAPGQYQQPAAGRNLRELDGSDRLARDRFARRRQLDDHVCLGRATFAAGTTSWEGLGSLAFSLTEQPDAGGHGRFALTVTVAGDLTIGRAFADPYDTIRDCEAIAALPVELSDATTTPTAP